MFKLSEWSIGDWLAVLGILVGIGVYMTTTKLDLETVLHEERAEAVRTEQVIRYLSSKDANYYQIVKQQDGGENDQ